MGRGDRLRLSSHGLIERGAVATFLQLVNKVERESGTISKANRLMTVNNPPGRQEKIVSWTAQAWEAIQRERSDWTFLRVQFSAALTIGKASYAPADLGLTNVARWIKNADGYASFTLYDPAIGRADETRLRDISFREWADRYDIGVSDATRPNVAALGTDKTIKLGPTPDKAYVLRGWYHRTIQTLTRNNDVPYIDEQYHDAIVWRALLMLNEDEEGAFQIGAVGARYHGLRAAMIKAYTEEVTT